MRALDEKSFVAELVVCVPDEGLWECKNILAVFRKIPDFLFVFIALPQVHSTPEN